MARPRDWPPLFRENAGSASGSDKVDADRLQNTPTSRFLNCRRRTIRTQRSNMKWSSSGISPPASANGTKSAAGTMRSSGMRSRNRRFVVAHFTLRQRHHWLKIDFDTVVTNGMADQGDDLGARHAAKRAFDDGCGRTRRRRGRARRCGGRNLRLQLFLGRRGCECIRRQRVHGLGRDRR